MEFELELGIKPHTKCLFSPVTHWVLLSKWPETLESDVIAEARGFPRVMFGIELSPEVPHDITNKKIGPAPAPRPKAAKVYNEWKDLQDLVGQVRHDAEAPAVAAAIVRGGRIVQ